MVKHGLNKKTKRLRFEINLGKIILKLGKKFY